MRRAVFFVPDEDVFLADRVLRRQDTPAGTWDYLQATLFEWIACYSWGDELAALRLRFKESVAQAITDYAESPDRTIPDLKDVGNYQVALALLSLTVLFDGDGAQVLRIRNIVHADGQDQLLDRLSLSVLPDLEISSSVLHPAPYRDLLAALDEPQPMQQRNATMRYLRTYYAGLQGAPWHETHLQAEAGFFGYWAFELAACVKLFALDDRPYCDNIYYPRDLAKDRFFRTWLPTGYGDSQRNAAAKLQAAWQKDADAQRSKIESELQKAQTNIRSFIEDVFASAHSPKSSKKSQQKLKRSAESLRFLSELCGEDSKALDANPDFAKSLIVNMLQSISQTALQSAGSGEEFVGLRNAMEEASAKIAADNPDAIQALEEAMPTEMRQAMEKRNANPQAAFRGKMQNFSAAIDGLLADGAIQEDELLKALENLAVEYGFAEPEPTIQEKVKADLDEKWDKLRAGKKMIDFTFEDLFNGAGNPES